MPTYTFKCKHCGHVVSEMLKIGKKLHKCPECKAPKGLNRVFEAPVVHDNYSPMSPRRGRGMNGQGRIEPGHGQNF